MYGFVVGPALGAAGSKTASFCGLWLDNRLGYTDRRNTEALFGGFVVGLVGTQVLTLASFCGLWCDSWDTGSNTRSLYVLCGGTRGTQVLTLTLFVVVCWDSRDTGSNTRSLYGFVV